MAWSCQSQYNYGVTWMMPAFIAVIPLLLGWGPRLFWLAIIAIFVIIGLLDFAGIGF